MSASMSAIVSIWKCVAENDGCEPRLDGLLWIIAVGTSQEW